MSNKTEYKAQVESSAAASREWRWRDQLTATPVLFGIITLVVLVALWSVTLSLIVKEKEQADQAAAALTSDIANTYEAQVVRSLREIDQTLKLVSYELGRKSPPEALDDLAGQRLLPPALLFTVSVFDKDGELVVTNGLPDISEAVAQDDLIKQTGADELAVGLPQRLDEEYFLNFARRHFGDDSQNHYLVTVTLPASYFVSGYEQSVLGKEGVLGLVGTDSIFRVRRTSDQVFVGDEIDYESVVRDSAEENGKARVRLNSWDGVHRYTVARELYQYPLAILVGLSQQEALAEAFRERRSMLWRASSATLLLTIVVVLLGRLSWRLQQERNRALEQRIEHAKRVEYLAFHDSLTGLPNRAFFSHLLTEGMAHARRYDKKFALLFLDLDRFKIINDSLGHEAGDELLQEVSARLRHGVRESDIVARLGGDEFVVLLPEISSAHQVSPVAEKILASVAKPFVLVGHEFRVTVSIGVTVFPDDGHDEQTLMKNADVAMYHAKEQGKNNFQFYSEALNIDSLERLALESSLRNALDRGEFNLYYQAKKDMSSGAMTGMEALLRWEHPELGIILPMQFIPMAEENGLIIPIGRWVFRTACQQNVAWQREGFPPLSIAVNLSARQFIDEHLLDDIVTALNETGMNPELLEVEITESMVMQDMKKTLSVLGSLKKIGVKVAIDDFGTGYSSLSTLKDFPVDTIKIDGSFVRDLASSAEDRGLTEAIIAVGRSLSLTVVAECVETSEQFDFLHSHCCDEFQGFYGSEALPAEQFARLMRDAEHKAPDSRKE